MGGGALVDAARRWFSHRSKQAAFSSSSSAGFNTASAAHAEEEGKEIKVIEDLHLSDVKSLIRVPKRTKMTGFDPNKKAVPV